MAAALLGFVVLKLAGRAAPPATPVTG